MGQNAQKKPAASFSANLNNREDVRAATAGCAGLTNSGGKYSPSQIASCNKVMDSVLSHGWLTDLPDVLLTLQGNPPKSKTDISDARDIVAQISNDLRAKVPAKTPQGKPVLDGSGDPVMVPKLKGVLSVTYCPPGSGKSCNTTPTTRNELIAALNNESAGGLTKKRALTLDTSSAAMIGIYDGYLNSSRYLRVKPNGQDMTLQQTAASIRSETPDAEIQRRIDLCRVAIGDMSSCNAIGARKGILAAADSTRRIASRF